MATAKDLTTQLKGQNLIKATPLEALITRDVVKKRFEEIMGKRANAFISSIISATKSNPSLMSADPNSILSSAVVAATLDLPINPNLGYAHIVPYGGKAQMQLGWKGYVQLALRTGVYKTMNASEVYDGEIKSWNRITGELELDMKGKKSDSVVGYVAFFRLTNGFEKYSYMTKEEIMKHGKRYSKSFGSSSSPWSQNFDAMALKTVLKLLLSKYGILSIELQRAMEVDQAVVIDADQPGAIEYPDSNIEEAQVINPKTKELLDSDKLDRNA